jgi:hypothetical protein
MDGSTKGEIRTKYIKVSFFLRDFNVTAYFLFSYSKPSFSTEEEFQGHDKSGPSIFLMTTNVRAVPTGVSSAQIPKPINIYRNSLNG